jgi:hypothetical protein
MILILGSLSLLEAFEQLAYALGRKQPVRETLAVRAGKRAVRLTSGDVTGYPTR